MEEYSTYETRTYKHILDEEDRTKTPLELLGPLEEICRNLGGRPNTLASRSDDTRAATSFAVSNTAGGMVQVDLGVSKAGKGLRQVKIISNAEGGEHASLRFAFHLFYKGRKGYEALPVPQKKSYPIKG